MTDLDSIYACHPLRAATILGRLDCPGAGLTPLTEWQLAIDPETEITDQNHSGGVQSVLELAVAAGVSRASTVVDVGAGLGGSGRVLAAAFGCRVIGIERDGGRCRDAVLLTERVKLDSLVTFQQADALSAAIDLSDVDVLWGQASWIHFPSPADFLARWVPVLGAGGRIAMADTFLARPPIDRGEGALVEALEAAWGAHLAPVDRWRNAIEGVGCRIVHLRDMTARAAADLATFREASLRWPEGTVTAAEKQSWEIAVAAIGRGLVSSWHLVATRDRAD